MLATPPATVAVAYAIKYDKEAALASNASLLGTVLAVFAIVFWIVVGSVIFPGVGLNQKSRSNFGLLFNLYKMEDLK